MKGCRHPLIALMILGSGYADAFGDVTGGPALDYQPSVIRSIDDGARVVVFERLDPTTTDGDLWMTRSLDNGGRWSDPIAIIATAANERHPALVQTGPSSYVLFYLKGASAASSFRIRRATSADGITFTEQAQLDLGWTSGGEINPHVIRHVDGRMTMSYQRLGSGSFVAESNDDGATWDTRRTSIASSSQLPRIAFREVDGVYLASYQVGSSELAMVVKTTTDVYDWSGAARGFAIIGNNHDSLPIVMPDGAFALFWIRASANQFDVAVRRSVDGVTWEPALAVTDSVDADDVEPHPLIDGSNDTVELYWGRGTPVGGSDYDIVRAADVRVSDVVFVDGFEGN